MSSWANSGPRTSTSKSLAPPAASTAQPLGTLSFSFSPGGRDDIFAVGELVEYNSASAGTWIPAKIQKVNGGGKTYDLDCKPDVPADRIRRPGPAASAGKAGPTAYSVGDVVEYFSASQGKWIPAKVLNVNPDGRYNLDCKPDVAADCMRRPTAQASGPSSLRQGDMVEYFSASLGKWIPAKVQAVKPDGRYDLDCKPDVPASSVRLPGDGASGNPKFKQGDSVEYFGSTQNKWIPAKVLKANADGTYDLDVKPGVTPEKIRLPQQASALGTGPVGVGTATSVTFGTLPPQSVGTAANVTAGTTFKQGEAVEYFSATQGKWIQAKVLEVTKSGNYNLDCKPDVHISKLRRLTSSPALDVKEGQAVEYFGASRGMWIPTKVVKVNEDGTFDLECKPRVIPENIRLQNTQRDAGSAGDLARGPVYNPGESVEYFGGTHGRWIPAKVIGVTPRGTYDLDCKQDVPVDRIRSAAMRGSARPGDRADPRRASSVASAASMSSTATLAKADGFAEPLQLLRSVRRGVTAGFKLEVCPEAVAALEKMGQRRVCVASVCGPAKSGKTYLVNHFMDRPQQGLPILQVGGNSWSKNKSEGVWVWAGATEANDRSPLILILDVEGFGDAGASSMGDACHGASRDMQLLAICGLLSSMLVMNSMGLLNEQVCDALRSACRFGDIVEERGGEADRPALLWLLRDFEQNPRNAEGQPMSPDEYLEHFLHGGPVLPKESSHKAGDVRHGLLKFFRHRNCDGLPAPTSNGRLESASYSSLNPEFRASVERLRARVFHACLGKPKAVNGKPLCAMSFVALLKQLVTAVNDGRILSTRAAWETVQHTSCGALADELRTEASSLFQALSSGQPLPGGAKLPLNEEALFTVMRDRRRSLKSQWDERAVGDEGVRLTYWKELKETLAREEAMVRTQNTRLADQQLMEGVRAWQEWLDKDDDAGVMEICSKLGCLLEKAPATSLSRASRITIQAAARRMSATRSAVASALNRHGELSKKAVEWGEKAAREEGTARSDLEAKKAELNDAVAEAKKKELELETVNKEVDAKEAEFQESQRRLKDQLKLLEESRVREQELRAKHRALSEAEVSLRADLEQARADLARTDAERLAEERLAVQAADAATTDQEQLRASTAEVHKGIEELMQRIVKEQEKHQVERQKLQEQHQKRSEETRAKMAEERNLLRSKQEQTRDEHLRMIEDSRRQIDREREVHVGTLDDDKSRLIEHSRTIGVFEGKALAVTEEIKSLRERVGDLEQKAHQSDLDRRQSADEAARLRSELVQAEQEVDRAAAEIEKRMDAAREELATRENEVEALEAEALLHGRGGKQPKCAPCTIQ